MNFCVIVYHPNHIKAEEIDNLKLWLEELGYVATSIAHLDNREQPLYFIINNRDLNKE